MKFSSLVPKVPQNKAIPRHRSKLCTSSISQSHRLRILSWTIQIATSSDSSEKPAVTKPCSTLSYEKNVDETGKPLPPTYVLRPVNGAPKDVLKPDAVLPCYVLRPGRYKILSQDRERKRNGVSLKGGAPPKPTTH